MQTTRFTMTLALALAVMVSDARAQSLGVFRWQLQPFCNVLTITVTQSGGVYTLDGYDDQCGAPTRAPLVGLATPNPDGTIGFGVQLVTSPAALPVAVRASVSLATVGGPWSDSAGNSGTLVLNGAAGGSPRPSVVPSFPGGLAAGGARVTNVGAPSSPSDAATKDYVDNKLPSAFTMRADGAFVARGDTSGAIPQEGAGRRLLWYPAKAAFRVGSVSGGQWDDFFIGGASFAAGADAVASGAASVALGDSVQALGTSAVAAGYRTTAVGVGSVALGAQVGACGNNAVALGQYASTSVNPVSSDPCQGTAVGGAFVFASGGAPFFSAVTGQEFAARAVGGFRFRTNQTSSTGCNLPAGSGAWTCTSDRNQKQDFEAVDGEDTLARLARIPIDRWSYKSEPGVRHVGPTAQDFRAAFGLGVDDISIGHVDLSGVSLRAIQALEARTTRLADENARLRAEIDEIRRLLTKRER